MHPNLELGTKAGMIPSTNRKHWVSPEIPFSAEEIDRVFPGRKATEGHALWFRKSNGQRYAFSMDEAQRVDPVGLREVEEAYQNFRVEQRLGSGIVSS